MNVNPVKQQQQSKGYQQSGDPKQKQYGSITGIIVETEERDPTTGKKKRIASPDLWEYTRLKGGNVLNLIDDANLQDMQNGADDNELLDEDEAEIELNDEEPPFLMGQTTKAGLCLSPIKISQNPDGSLQRAAMQSGQRAKDRKDIRDQQQRANSEALPKDLNKIRDDPTANPAVRNLASTLKTNAFDLPDWKKDSITGKQPTQTSRVQMSIQDQKESLPIYKLRSELINAIWDNRILVVIGETGSGKTTQMPQYLNEMGLCKYGKKVGCT